MNQARYRGRLVVGLLAGWLAGINASAQEIPSDTLLTVQHYLDWETVADPQISPDGTRIIYTRRWVNQLEDRWESATWIMNADGSRQRFLLNGNGARWSPDGTRIAYVGDAGGMPQIFVRWMDPEGSTSRATMLVAAAPSSLAWSPDGNWISFAAPVKFEREWKIGMPAAPPGAKWTPPPRRITDLHYRMDRVGFMEQAYIHLFVVSAEGGVARQVTQGPFNAGARFDQLGREVGYDWTPDGKSIVFDGYRGPAADDNYRNSDLHVVAVATGAIRKLTARPGTWRAPAVSPDGRTVAFAGYDSTRKSYQAAELWFIGIDGAGQRLGSGPLDRDVSNLSWAADGSGVYFTVTDRGTSDLHFASLRGGERKWTSGNHLLSVSSIAATGIAVGTRASSTEPGDVVAFSLVQPASVRKLTDVNGDVLRGIRLGDVEEIWYSSTGGVRVQGWLVKPPNFDRSRKYPLVLEIHGGPHSSYTVAFNYMFQNFAANQHLVLYVNPRGSIGYGTDFGNAIERAYPGVDYDDLIAGVDTVIGRGFVDIRRLYVGGCSGGGALSSWVIGHTTRFAAAAVRCPVIDWISMAGTSDVPLFARQWFEKPFWDDPGPWLERSPLMYVHKVKTPTLVMTGELDLRTPMGQSEQFYSALKYLGVPTELLRFNGEYHVTTSKPSNFMRTLLYMMSWYQRYPSDARRDRDR